MPPAPKPQASASSFVDPEIEASLLGGLLQRRAEVLNAELIPFLRGDLFGSKPYGWLIDNVIKKSAEPPPRPVLSQLIQEHFADVEERELHTVALLRLYDVDLTWLPDAVGVFRRYLSFQLASSGTKIFHEKFAKTRNADLALRDMEESLSRARRVLSSQSAQVYDFAKGWQERETQRITVRDNPQLKPRLRFGIAKFDQQVKMDAGTVTMLLAPMKRYKSVFLAGFAFAGLLQGFNVVLAVAENTVELTMSRLDSMFTQISYSRITQGLKTRKEKEYADALFERMNGWPNRLKVIKGEPNKLGVLDVERKLDVLREEEGFEAEVGIFDYLNILKPSTTLDADGKPMRDDAQQTQIMWDLQAFAKRPGRERIAITAGQTNMDGAAVDKEGKPVSVQITHNGRAIGIMQAVDNFIGIDLDPGKAEGNMLQPPQIILSILFLRNAPILYPKIRLVSEIDRMCVDRESRSLWAETTDYNGRLVHPPGDGL